MPFQYDVLVRVATSVTKFRPWCLGTEFGFDEICIWNIVVAAHIYHLDAGQQKQLQLLDDPHTL